MERRGDGLTTEDLAGTRAGRDEDLRIENDEERTDARQDADGEDATASGQGQPIAVGPVEDPPIILDERQDSAPEKVDISEDSEARGASSTAISDERPEGAGPLIAESDRDGFTDRWKEVQFQFVEDPRSAVQEADELVAEVMQRLAQTFAEERANLESQWSRGDEVSTEDLRQALRRYRAFFDRLLGV